MENERWLPVIGMPDYEVSDLGGIRSVTRVYSRPHPRNKSMTQTRTVLGKTIKPNMTTNGYLQLNAGRKGVRSIHRAVIESFVYAGPIPDGLIVCHKDGDRSNNRLENLYAGSYVDNRKDAEEHGTLCLRPNAKLSWSDVCEIRESNISANALSKKYGVSTTAILLVRKYATWKLNEANASRP